MGMATLVLFCAAITVCILFGFPVAYALLAGLGLFWAYGLLRRHSVRMLLRMSWSGLFAARNVIITFLFIGTVTASWRASGTIAYIIYHSVKIITPGMFLPCAFGLCCLVSFLLGSTFGTVASVGFVCMSIGDAMGIPPVLAGGAIISGIYFGDRCSPVSACTNLVAEITGANIYSLIPRLLRRQLGPWIITALVYTAAGFTLDASDAAVDATAVFARSYVLSPATLAPAAAILVFGALRVPVRLAMACSTALALGCWLWLQNGAWSSLPGLLWGGFAPPDAQLAALLGGGGIVSMDHAIYILLISAPYAGIFAGTGLLRGVRFAVLRLQARTSPFGAVLVAGAACAIIACSQTLSTLLTNQICPRRTRDNAIFAGMLSDTCVVLAALIPWSTAGAVPVAILGAPQSALLFACYLYLIPLWHLAFHRHE